MGRRRDSNRDDVVDLGTTRDLVEEVLRTALALEGVMASLLDDVREDVFPGEDSGAVLLEMLVGSVHPAAVAAGSRECRAATALVVAIRHRVLADLRAAAELADARESG